MNKKTILGFVIGVCITGIVIYFPFLDDYNSFLYNPFDDFNVISTIVFSVIPSIYLFLFLRTSHRNFAHGILIGSLLSLFFVIMLFVYVSSWTRLDYIW